MMMIIIVIIKTAGVRGKTQTAYLDDITSTLACSICTLKMNSFLTRNPVRACAQEHVSKTDVKTSAW
jgi:hypothetical protein